MLFSALQHYNSSSSRNRRRDAEILFLFYRVSDVTFDPFPVSEDSKNAQTEYKDRIVNNSFLPLVP